jgi:ABC-type multidrug transport system ATPase subunit
VWHDIVTEADAVRRLISLAGQFAAVDKHLTARENIILTARLRGRSLRSALAVADELAEFSRTLAA